MGAGRGSSSLQLQTAVAAARKFRARGFFCGGDFSTSSVRFARLAVSAKPGNICAEWVSEFAEVASPPLLSNALRARW